MIELNGAFVSDLESGRHLVSNVLPAPVAGVAVEAIAATGSDPVLTAADGHVYFGARANAGTSWFVDEKRAYGADELTLCADLPAIARRERLAAIAGFVPDSAAVA